MIDVTELKKWATDLERINLFKDLTLTGNVAVVEVYKEKTTEENNKVEIIFKESSSGKPEKRAGKLDTLIHPIAKVLALGNNVSPEFIDIKPGYILYLPDSIKNTIPNPEYINMLISAKGNEEPKIPPGMTRNVAVFDDTWGRFRFQIDKTKEMTPVDSVTFLVPLMSTMVLGYKKEI